MLSRFRMLAGPNGSGKSTLKRRLERDYAVNFYDFLNADEIFAEARETGAFAPHLAVDGDGLRSFAEASSYGESVKELFRNGSVAVIDECVRFSRPEAVTSYTVALLTGYLQAEHIRQGTSFSQETVFSHPSKIESLAAARAAGFRTYLYFVGTESPEINLGRVENRVELGGHAVPAEKIVSRHALSLGQIPAALPHLSRAYFFDNSGETMRYLAEWNAESGLSCVEAGERPAWFAKLLPSFGGEVKSMPRGTALETSAAAASREAIAEAFAAGLPITVMDSGKIRKIVKFLKS